MKQPAVKHEEDLGGKPHLIEGLEDGRHHAVVLVECPSAGVASGSSGSCHSHDGGSAEVEEECDTWYDCDEEWLQQEATPTAAAAPKHEASSIELPPQTLAQLGTLPPELGDILTRYLQVRRGWLLAGSGAMSQVVICFAWQAAPATDHRCGRGPQELARMEGVMVCGKQFRAWVPPPIKSDEHTMRCKTPLTTAMLVAGHLHSAKRTV